MNEPKSETERQLETTCRLADAQALVAENLGWLLACTSGVLVWAVLECRDILASPASWIGGIVVGVVIYRLAVRKYHKASERAWAEYQALLKSANT